MNDDAFPDTEQGSCEFVPRLRGSSCDEKDAQAKAGYDRENDVHSVVSLIVAV